MNKLSYYGAIDQNIRKFRQVSHALSFLCMKTTFPHCKMKSLSARKCVKLAKSLGWDPKRNWREYPDKWQLRPEYAKDPLTAVMKINPGAEDIDIENVYPKLGIITLPKIIDAAIEIPKAIDLLNQPLDINVEDQYPKVWTEHNQPVEIMKVRRHCELLEDAMKTVVEIPATMDELWEHVNKTVDLGADIYPEMLNVTAYGFDPRINWETYIITLDNWGPYGFCNKKPLPFSSEMTEGIVKRFKEDLAARRFKSDVI